jgi:hypothetical protein
MFKIDLDLLTNFITNLNENEIYLINPVIFIHCKHNDPYVTLSRQFLITNKSNPTFIEKYLLNQLFKFRDDFQFDDDYYFLIFKYKSVILDHRYIG